VKAAVRKIAASCSEVAARTSAWTSSGLKTSIAPGEASRGFSTFAAGLTGSRYTRQARAITPWKITMTLRFVASDNGRSAPSRRASAPPRVR
jgi:hypothetical protein